MPRESGRLEVRFEALLQAGRIRQMWRMVVTPIVAAGVYGVLAGAFHFLGGAIDQPHPEYMEGNWITHRLPDSVGWSAVIAAVMFVLVLVDLAVQNLADRAGHIDLAYFPRLHQFHDYWRVASSRWVLICAGLFFVFYWTLTSIEVWKASLICHIAWPPERVFISGLLFCGAVWVADCLRRPRRTTIIAAIGLTLFTFACILPIFGIGVLRE